MEQIVFGINGGGTFSRLRIEKNGKHLKTLYGKGTNLFVNSAQEVEQNLKLLFLQAKEQFDISISDYNAGCIGSAGVDRNRLQNVKVFQSIFRNLGFDVLQRKKIDICNDGEILLVGAFNNVDTVGSILIAGTGSIAIAKTAGNTIHRFGGHGHVIGDEGSGYWIATQIFATVLKEFEQGKTSQMRDVLLGYMAKNSNKRYSTALDIIPYVYSLNGKADISKHAQLLTTELIAQDVNAKIIAQEAAKELYTLFMRMYYVHPDSAKNLVLDGSVLTQNTYIREFFQKLSKKQTQTSFITEEETAEKGACLLASKFLL